MNRKLIEHLSGFISERRVQLFDTILNLRTRYITVVLENIYQPHNASAVLRSCECFGVQDVHLIENENEFRISPDITLGSDKWLNLVRYNQLPHNTDTALSSLKSQGYRIVATTPHKNDCALEDFDLRKGKFALVLGTELKGLSPAALALADEYIKIPMVGFTESLNISVTSALCIHHLTGKLRSDPTIPWSLTAEEKLTIKLTWLKNSIRKSDLIVKAFLARHEQEDKDH